MASFYEQLVSARENSKDTKELFIECLQDLFVRDRATFCRTIEQMKLHLIARAKSKVMPLTTEYSIDIGSVFNTLNRTIIQIELPESYHPDIKNIAFIGKNNGKFPSVYYGTEILTRFICEHVGEVGEWLQMLRNTFDKAKIECSIIYTHLNTMCFFVMKVVYYLDN